MLLCDVAGAPADWGDGVAKPGRSGHVSAGAVGTRLLRSLVCTTTHVSDPVSHVCHMHVTVPSVPWWQKGPSGGRGPAGGLVLPKVTAHPKDTRRGPALGQAPGQRSDSGLSAGNRPSLSPPAPPCHQLSLRPSLRPRCGRASSCEATHRFGWDPPWFACCPGRPALQRLLGPRSSLGPPTRPGRPHCGCIVSPTQPSYGQRARAAATSRPSTPLSHLAGASASARRSHRRGFGTDMGPEAWSVRAAPPAGSAAPGPRGGWAASHSCTRRVPTLPWGGDPMRPEGRLEVGAGAGCPSKPRQLCPGSPGSPRGWHSRQHCLENRRGHWVRPA